MDCFSWCFLLPPLPACLSPKTEFLTGFGSPDYPCRTSILLSGADRIFPGCQLPLGTSTFWGAQLVAGSSLLIIGLTAPEAIFTPVSPESEPGGTKIKHCLGLAAWHSCPQLGNRGRTPLQASEELGCLLALLASFQTLLSKGTSLSKVPTGSICTWSELGIICNRNAFRL